MCVCVCTDLIDATEALEFTPDFITLEERSIPRIKEASLNLKAGFYKLLLEMLVISSGVI